jgi:hypothetical protein
MSGQTYILVQSADDLFHSLRGEHHALQIHMSLIAQIVRLTPLQNVRETVYGAQGGVEIVTHTAYLPVYVRQFISVERNKMECIIHVSLC